MKSFITIFIMHFLALSFLSSFAQTSWKRELANSVLSHGNLGSWEDWSAYAPSVLKQGDTLRMWYTGAKSFDVQQIGYAVSTDGINWQKHNSNPVLTVGPAGSWDNQYVGHPEVIFVDSLYHMWYGGSVDNASFRIGYATSPDGIDWTKYNDPLTTNPPYTQSDPVLSLGDPGEWDSATHGGCSIFFDGDSFNMWYGGCDNTNYIKGGFGYATSPDGINWIKYAGNPIFSGSAGSWDSLKVTVPFVIVDSSGYRMWYQGNDGSSNWRIGYATSRDGINWSALDTCVLDIGSPGNWDDKAVSNPCVLFDQTTYKMWYTGLGYVTSNYAVGYATAPLVTRLGEIGSERLPKRFVLKQNYPNPFNPTTTIKFQIPNSKFTTLKVYNILGKEVSTLVSKKLNPGIYTYTFNGKNLASGIYYYQLVAGDYQEVKKMILLR
jgi:predicted GH43/DUF377 family glycosyl hydrolase